MNWSRRAPFSDLVGGCDDGLAHAGFEPSELHVCTRSGALDEHGCGDEVGGGVEAADREVFGRANRLDAVVGVGRNRVLAERIVLDAGHLQIILIECPQLFSTVWSRSSFVPPPIFHLMCARR